MQKFTDAENRTWHIEVTVPVVRRVLGRLEVQLLDLIDVDGPLFKRLLKDPCFLCDVLFVICEPQATGLNVSDEDFGRALRGNALEDATEALLRGIADFFPDAKREVLMNLLGKMDRYQELALRVISQRLTAETKKLDTPEGVEEIELEISQAIFARPTASGRTKTASVTPGSSESIHSLNPA
jgi:hypothetical protein